MGPSDFVAELRRLGHDVSELGDGRISFPYLVPVGAHAGETVCIGLTVPTDFPLTCPGGPVVSPRLLPLNPDGTIGHPFGAVHASPEFGDAWEYWSRPYPGWHASSRTAAAYLAHIAHLFESVP